VISTPEKIEKRARFSTVEKFLFAESGKQRQPTPIVPHLTISLVKELYFFLVVGTDGGCQIRPY